MIEMWIDSWSKTFVTNLRCNNTLPHTELGTGKYDSKQAPRIHISQQQLIYSCKMSSLSSSVQTAEEPTKYTLVIYGDNDMEEGRCKYTKNAEGKLIKILYSITGGPVYFMEEEMIEDLE